MLKRIGEEMPAVKVDREEMRPCCWAPYQDGNCRSGIEEREMRRIGHSTRFMAAQTTAVKVDREEMRPC